VTNLDWQSLAIEVEDRSAIFSEEFPAQLTDALLGDELGRVKHSRSAAFDTTAALEVLATFAPASDPKHPTSAVTSDQQIALRRSPPQSAVALAP